MTAPGRTFCAVECATRGEEMFATVARIERWALVEYPTFWRKRAFADSSLPAEVKRLLARRSDRQLLVRQSHAPVDEVRCFFADASERGPSLSVVQASTWEAFGDAPALALAEPLYAVCTHGTHDKCCAKFGIPLYCTLRDTVGAAAWQCSHVGGDRFAGNVVVFPYGIYYGRVMPHDVQMLVDKTKLGEIVLRHYRGRSCYPRAVQAAEYFLRRETGLLGIAAVRLASFTAETLTSDFVGADGERFRVSVRLVPDFFEARLTCSAEEASPIPQYELASLARAGE